MWVRGLKSIMKENKINMAAVAPHVGAWIEINRGAAICRPSVVAPHVGAWIEISDIIET